MKKNILLFIMVSLSALSSYAQDLYVGGSFQLKHYSNSEISQFAISPENRI